jgi:hypothetical protein
MEAQILWQSEEYNVQNFPLPPRENGLPRRQGGRFRPRMYTSNEDLSHVISPDEFRREYAPSFQSGSFVEQYPVNRIGTGHRRVEVNPGHEDHASGMDVLGVADCIECCCVVA